MKPVTSRTAAFCWHRRDVRAATGRSRSGPSSRKIFPGQQLVRLKPDHPLFQIVYNVTTLTTTHGIAGSPLATLEAYTLHGHIVLIFSSDGLNDTGHAGSQCCCCGGDEIEKAEFLNVNVLAYALLH